MTKLRSRLDIAKTGRVFDMYFSGDMMNQIWKRNRPACCENISWPHPGKVFSDRDTYRIVKTKNGEYWCEWSSPRLIWVHRWYEMPKTVGQRAEAIVSLF